VRIPVDLLWRLRAAAAAVQEPVEEYVENLIEKNLPQAFRKAAAK
jgi:hypothetical protein